MSLHNFKKLRLALGVFFSLVVIVAPFSFVTAESVNKVKVSDLMHQANIFFGPGSGTFIEGTTFDSSIYIDTKGGSINTIDLTIRFDPSKLQIVHSLGGKSIIGIWLEPPSYSNTSGTMHLTGTIPNGVTTGSGLITTITFKAINSGRAKISLSDTTQVLANDGLGSNVVLQLGQADYTVTPTPPGGVKVFSETHPFQDRWYNNNSPSFAWEKEDGVSNFSYVFDDKPFTTPDNETSVTGDTAKGFEKIPDGIWYFHIKAKKHGVWGAPTHYLVRIDTAPPAQFTPTVDVLSAAVIHSRGLVSFFTTDTLSGVDHYEVGVIPPNQALDATPAFVEVDSPYELPGNLTGKTRVIVRAFDRAGNIRSATVDASPVSFLGLLVKDNFLTVILSLVIAILLLLLIFVYFKRKIFLYVDAIEEIAHKHELEHDVASLEGRELQKPTNYQQ